MFMSKKLLLGGAKRLRVGDVFASTAYATDGASTSVPLGFAPEMTWDKLRTINATHSIRDFLRPGKALTSATTSGEANSTITVDGVSKQFQKTAIAAGNQAVNWSFRRAEKFFDVVYVTGNSVSARKIPHGLTVPPGMFVHKRLDSTSNWKVYHTGIGAGSFINLHSTAVPTSSTVWSSTSPDAAEFTLNNNADTNVSGQTYIVYLFAHDPSPSGIIQCGQFTTNGSGVGSYTHGWAGGSQFALIKASSTTGDWEMYDQARSPGWVTDLRLRANLTSVEDTVTRISEIGGTITFSGLSASQTYILMLVRA